MVSFRGKKKAWATPRSVYFRGSKFPTSIPTPFICGVSPGLKHTSCSMRGSRIRNMHEARDKRCARAGPTTSPPVLISALNLSCACYASLHILRTCGKYIERLLIKEESG